MNMGGNEVVVVVVVVTIVVCVAGAIESCPRVAYGSIDCLRGETSLSCPVGLEAMLHKR